MSKLNGRTVTYARMHTTVFVPGFGQFGPELSAIQTPTTKACDMVVEGEVVLCSLKDKVGKTVEMVIPFTNFTNFVVRPE